MYIAREGVATSDLFRRPGSHTDLKLIVRRLAEGSPVQLSDYNFYTLASVIKVIGSLTWGVIFQFLANQTLVMVDLLTGLLYLDDNYATGSAITGIYQAEFGVGWKALNVVTTVTRDTSWMLMSTVLLVLVWLSRVPLVVCHRLVSCVMSRLSSGSLIVHKRCSFVGR